MSTHKLQEFVSKPRGSFDSWLNTALQSPRKNVTLKIQLRVCLQQVPAGVIHDHTGVPWQTPGWTDIGWRNFKTSVKSYAEFWFNNRFWLQAPFTYDGFDFIDIEGMTIRRHVACQFEMIVLSDPQFAHHVVKVVNFPAGNDAYKGFRSNAGLWDVYDMQWASFKDSKGTTHHQIVMLHELAHLLGIDHPGVAIGVCEPHEGEPVCYEGKTPQHTDSLGGMGMAMTELEARPWTRRLAEHTNVRANQWQIWTRKIHPIPLFGPKGHAFSEQSSSRLADQRLTSPICHHFRVMELPVVKRYPRVLQLRQAQSKAPRGSQINDLRRRFVITSVHVVLGIDARSSQPIEDSAALRFWHIQDYD